MSDLATVSTGNPREPEIADQSRHGNVVQGIILMRHGPESPPTGELVQLEINNINTSDVLPPGVRIEKIEDRADLINTPMVLRDAIVGAALILTLQWLWLGRTGVRALANRIVIVGGMAAYAYLGTQLT